MRACPAQRENKTRDCWPLAPLYFPSKAVSLREWGHTPSCGHLVYSLSTSYERAALGLRGVHTAALPASRRPDSGE